MKLDLCLQGGQRWLDLHVGRPTASQFHRIITAKKMEFAAATEGYRNELIAEELVGHPLNDFVTQYIQRGKDLEEDARRFYQMTRDVDVQEVGFVLRDDDRTGCSPDGLVGTDGGLEIKTPSVQNHVGYMIDGIGDEYRAQVQGCIWLCEREWWDVLSYNPELEPVLTRVARDDAFIAKLAPYVDRFISYLDESRDKLIQRGMIKQDIRLVA